MRILHTSDWHLGHNFYTKDRKREHQRFLDWLLSCLSENRIDALIISGDIFDTAAPPNYALELYYRFIKGLAKTPCKQTIIVGGNHDSASNLHAPKELLKLFNVHIVGSISKQSPKEDIFVLNNCDEKPACLVCAVPFLRERDVRSSLPGETYKEKSLSYQEGISAYYGRVFAEAQNICKKLGCASDNLPIIATGHLFTAGSELSDGVREISVGSLDGISAAVFPSGFDYVALGHLHKAQLVQGNDSMRYCGSPLPLSFGEARFAKQVVVADFTSGIPPKVEAIEVPSFQKIESVKGDWSAIENYFSTVENQHGEIWLEVVLETDDWGEEVQGRINEMAEATTVQVLAVKRRGRNVLSMQLNNHSRPTLAELEPGQVFDELLSQADITEHDECSKLRLAHDELLEQAWQKWRGAQHED